MNGFYLTTAAAGGHLLHRSVTAELKTVTQ